MCANCSTNWRNAKQLGPIRFGYGQISTDPSTWVIWVTIFRLYIGYMPAMCYWRWKLDRNSAIDYMFGGGNISSRKRNVLALSIGPLTLERVP